MCVWVNMTFLMRLKVLLRGFCGLTNLLLFLYDAFFFFFFSFSNISVASSAIILHTYISNHLYVMCFAFYFLQNKKKIFSSISCFFFHYLYRRLMFLLSFRWLLLASNRTCFCLPSTWCVFVCVYVRATLLLVINQAIQFDFSTLIMASRNNETFYTTQLLQLSKRAFQNGVEGAWRARRGVRYSDWQTVFWFFLCCFFPLVA